MRANPDNLAGVLMLHCIDKAAHKEIEKCSKYQTCDREASKQLQAECWLHLTVDFLQIVACEEQTHVF